MPSWIEAMLTFLKKQISLRFAMFWFLSWMLLLLFIPSVWTEFIDSGIGKWSVPYIGSAIFLIPVSFFISLITKSIYNYFFSVSEEKKDKRKLINAKKILHSLNDEESEVVRYIFENGSTDYMQGCSMTTICRLTEKNIIYGIGGMSPSSHTYYLYELYEKAIISIVAANNQ